MESQLIRQRVQGSDNHASNYIRFMERGDGRPSKSQSSLEIYPSPPFEDFPKSQSQGVRRDRDEVRQSTRNTSAFS